MNVVLFGEVTTAEVGSGAERVLYEQAQGLHHLGHQVEIVARAPEGDSRPEIMTGSIKERRYPVSRRNEANYVCSTVQHSIQCFDTTYRANPVQVGLIHQSLAGLGPIYRRNAHAHGWVYMCLSLAHEEFLSRQISGSTCVERLRYSLNVQFRKIMEQAVMKRCARVVVLSDFMRRRVLAAHNVPEEKLCVIPGAADLSRFHPTDDSRSIRQALQLPLEKVILFTVRNLDPRMGLDTLIHAIAALRREAKNILLLIGGDGPLRGKLQQLVEELNLGDRVKMLGFIPEDVLPKYYQAADLVVMPTQHLEGFGLVTVEALACGTPVLGTPVGAIPEVLAQVDPCLLSEGSDEISLTNAIQRILTRFRESPGEKTRLADKGVTLVNDRYSWSHHNLQLSQVLHEVCNG